MAEAGWGAGCQTPQLSKRLQDPLLPAPESRIKDETASPLPPAVPSAVPASNPWVLLRGIRRRDDFCGGSDLHFYVLQVPVNVSLLAYSIILGYLRCAL